jgi:hypothetical protein
MAYDVERTSSARLQQRRAAIVRAIVLLCTAGATACGDDKTWSGEVPVADAQVFASDVYPLLMRDCAFNDCHGGTSRFFQVFGPGRVRIDPMADSEMPATLVELQVSYERARSMLISEGSVTHSLLLTKPLAIKAGGVGHRGVDAYGRNVYQSTEDPSYQMLVRWAQGATMPATTGQAGAQAMP